MPRTNETRWNRSFTTVNTQSEVMARWIKNIKQKVHGIYKNKRLNNLKIRTIGFEIPKLIKIFKIITNISKYE